MTRADEERRAESGAANQRGAEGTQAARPSPAPLSRRGFLRGLGEAASVSMVAGAAAGAAHAARGAEARAPRALRGEFELVLRINGREQTLRVQPRTTLLAALRERCTPPLTGTKLVCDKGNCGACTVLLDGQPVYACLTLAADALGREVRTVEGLAEGDRLSPLQQAFVERDALMCGFCTPGFLMSLTACLERNPAADQAQIARACSGNTCRCGTYPHILDAALDAGRRLQGGR